MGIHKRIEQIMNYKNLNYRSLGLRLKYSDTQTRNVIIGKSVPKVDFIQNLLRIYPEINSMWLISGEGEMLRTNEELPKATLEKFEDISDDELSLYILKNKERILNNEVILFYIDKLALEKATEMLKQDIKSNIQ